MDGKRPPKKTGERWKEKKEKHTIQIGAVNKLKEISLRVGSIALIITFAYNCTPIPTPTTPKYITSNGYSLQSKNTASRSRIVHADE